LRAKVALRNGKNEVKIIASNASGKASAKIFITRKTSNVSTPVEVVDSKKPVIEIKSISQGTINPMNPKQVRSTIIASVLYVKSKRDIKFFHNGQNFSNFSFDTKSNNLMATVILSQGSNSIKIRATNSAGTTEVTRAITKENIIEEDPGKTKMKTTKSGNEPEGTKTNSNRVKNKKRKI